MKKYYKDGTEIKVGHKVKIIDDAYRGNDINIHTIVTKVNTKDPYTIMCKAITKRTMPAFNKTQYIIHPIIPSWFEHIHCIERILPKPK